MALIITKKNSTHGSLLVITDKDILGKRFSEGKLQLDLSKEFYQGEEKSNDEVKKMIPEARHLHLTGKEAVALGIEMDLVESKNILYVKKVPHAQVVMGE